MIHARSPVDLVRGELERLFSLEEMTALSALVGLAPDDVGGTTAKGSFALALTERCLATDRIDALIDAMAYARQDIDPRVRDVGVLLGAPALAAGERLGAFVVGERVGDNAFGAVYEARRGDLAQAFTLTVLGREAERDRRRVQQFLTAQRLVARLAHAGMPVGLEVGERGELHWVAHETPPGEPLSSHRRPLPLGEALPLLRAILVPLAALHAGGLAHGGLALERVIASEGRAVLVGFGLDRLRGETATPRTDVRDFGVLFGELVGSQGGADVDALLAKLTSSDAGRRPKDAVVVLDLVSALAADGASGTRRSVDYDELIERLLGESERAPAGDARGRVLAEIGRVYASELDDAEQGVVAFTQALCQDPTNDTYASEVERLSGADKARWSEQLETIAAAIANFPPEAAEHQIALHLRAARWYDVALGKTDRALEAYEAVYEVDPANDAAVEGLVGLHRRAQRWSELAKVLLARSDSAMGPRARDLRAEAAEVLAERLGDEDRARAILAGLLDEDPGHVAASDAMARLTERAGDFGALAAVLERRAAVRQGAAKVESLVKAGEVHEQRLDDLASARRCYEAALAIEPESEDALRRLDRVLLRSGKYGELLELLERQISLTPTPRQKIQLLERAAKIREEEFLDPVAAAHTYERILGVLPEHAGALEALARLHVRQGVAERGDWLAVAGRIEREIERATNDPARARLWGELAQARREAGDAVKAEAAAQRAIDLDRTNAPSLVILGDVAFDGGRFADASRLYGDVLEPGRLAAGERSRVLARAARAAFESGDHARSRRLHAARLEEDPTLSTSASARADVLFHLGESARRARDPAGAIAPLREAAALDGTARTFSALAQALDGAGDAAGAVAALGQKLSVVPADLPAERFETLVEMGDLQATKLGDRAAAARSYSQALEVRPDERKLLTKLMQIYSEEEDWAKVCAVVLRLANFVEEPKQRAKYMHTAATLTATSLHDAERALDFYRRALEFDPGLEKARTEAIALHRARGEHSDVARLLEGRLELARTAEDAAAIVATLDELGDLYRNALGDPDLAIEAYEAAHAFDPERLSRAAQLSELYGAAPAKYFDQAIAMETSLLQQNPYRVESYKALRRLYAVKGRDDAAWCLCQALSILRLADADEERTYLAHRAENAAAARSTLDEAAWATITHPDAAPILTRIFAMIEPTMVRTRTRTLEEEGFDPRTTIDCSLHPEPVSQTLYYAQGVLAIPPPLVFEDASDPGMLGIVHARPPAIVLGKAAFDPAIGNQPMAFLAGRRLTSFLPGFYGRHLVPTGTGLKAWLFAAIKSAMRDFAVPPELAGQVDEAMRDLAADLGAVEKERLASAVAKLLHAGGALDLKRWVAGIDYTADRVGFLLAHDLRIATEAIRSTEKDASVPVKERMKEIVLFAVSEGYFALRAKLGIGT